ncbi:MAG: hypothetical protein CM15mP105_0010 [Methanobacteriota archaeon]|nr:MAG: hypothetical protein CM15mP105_0010 [Euryarchaeota archaeon]
MDPIPVFKFIRMIGAGYGGRKGVFPFVRKARRPYSGMVLDSIFGLLIDRGQLWWWGS